MSWAKLDDQFFTHPKVIDLPKDAKLLFLAALTHCTGQLTNGFITPGALRVVAATVDVSRDEAQTLVAAGLWETADGGWQVHDYLVYQPTRDKALATKQSRAEAGSKGGHKSADSKAQARSQANDKANPQAKSEAKSNPIPSYPLAPTEQDLREEYMPKTAKPFVGACASEEISGQEAPEPDEAMPDADAERPSDESKPPARAKNAPRHYDLPGFGRFWAVFPKKKDKDLALAEWDKLKPDSELQAVIIANVQTSCLTDDWQREAGQFIPYPCRYLKRRRWEDELTPVPASKPVSLPETRRIFDIASGTARTVPARVNP